MSKQVKEAHDYVAVVVNYSKAEMSAALFAGTVRYGLGLDRVSRKSSSCGVPSSFPTPSPPPTPRLAQVVRKSNHSPHLIIELGCKHLSGGDNL
jgi:hypothetical protein